MKKSRIRLSKYYLQLFVLCLGLGTLPVIIQSLYSYHHSTGLVRQKVSEANLHLLQQARMNVEQAMKAAFGNAIQVQTSPVFMSAMNTSVMHPSNISLYQQLTSDINRLQNYDLGIMDYTLVNFSHNWVMNTTATTPFNEVDGREALVSYARKPGNNFWIRDDRGDVLLVLKYPILTEESDPIGIIVMKMSKEYLTKLFLQHNDWEGAFILDEKGQLVTAVSGEQHHDDAFADFVASGLANVQGRGSLEMKLDGSKFTVSYLKSEYNGWTYTSVISNEKISRESAAIGWTSFYLAFGILLCAAAVSIWGAGRIYTPVRRLYENVTKAFQERQPGPDKDELRVIDGYFRQLSANHKLLSLQMRELFSLKLLLGSANPQETEERLESYGGASGWRQLGVMVAQLDIDKESRFHLKDHDLVLYAIYNIAGELFAGRNLFTPVMFDQSVVTVIVIRHETAAEYKKYTAACAEELQQAVRQYLNTTVSISISRSFSLLGEAAAAYREGLEALKYSVITDRQTVLFVDELHPPEQARYTYPAASALQLLDAVKMGDRDKAGEGLALFLHEVFLQRLHHQDFQLMLMRLLSELIAIVQEIGISAPAFFKEERNILHQLYEYKAQEELEQWLMSTVITPIIELKNSHSETQYSKIAQQALDLIHGQYDTDITLDSCADTLGYHPSYIKQVFRKATGSSFSDYLLQYRMMIAKKWLLETDMKIAEISEKLRYTNSQNFIRSFRKSEGMTPGQYRETK